MDKQNHTIKVFGIGSCIDCGRTFVFNAAQGFTPEVDSKICRACIDRINSLRAVDGLPPLGGTEPEPDFSKKTSN